jgi:cytochrome c peroxidase
MDKTRGWRLGEIAVCVAATIPWAAFGDPSALPPLGQATRLRHPVAAALLADGQMLSVANRWAGSVSIVDLRRGHVCEELAIGQRLAGLAVLPDHRHLLAIDEQSHELIALAFDGARLRVRARLPVGPYPVSIAVQEDGSQATVASLWSRRLEVIDLTPLASPAGSVSLRIVHVLRLPFAPRDQCTLGRRPYVAVADAFGGHLAIVDVAAGRLIANHELSGHNMRGLSLTAGGKELLLSHQVLNQRAATTRENIERGVLMANVIRLLPLDRVLTPGTPLDATGRLLRLGTQGAGAGDPAGLAILDAEHVAVALAGVGEVALVRTDDTTVWRVAVGRRPMVLLLPPAAEKGMVPLSSKGESLLGGQRLVAINTLDDSLSLIDARRGTVTGSISLGPRPELGPSERGEVLFYNARLSRHGWLSCHSCHSDGHSNGLLADTLGDNTYGTPKRTLTLLNTALTDPWAWNGEMKYLHDQVRQSLAETMHAPVVTADQINDLVSFLHTLPPPPPVEPVRSDEADQRSVKRGRRVFEERGCSHCHIPPLTYTSHGTYDVGFADEHGHRMFNPPSLRGVGQGYRFLHDNRAATLEEVFSTFRHKVGEGMTTADLADLLRFLRSL